MKQIIKYTAEEEKKLRDWFDKMVKKYDLGDLDYEIEKELAELVHKNSVFCTVPVHHETLLKRRIASLIFYKRGNR